MGSLMQEYGLSGTSSKHVDSPIPTPYTHVGQWDLSTPVICYPESSYISHWIIKNQLPVCRRSASPPPIPFQPYGHSNFLTLKSDYISLLLQCLPWGQVHAPQPGPPQLTILPLCQPVLSPGWSPQRGRAVPPPALHLCASLTPGVSSCSHLFLILQGSDFTSCDPQTGLGPTGGSHLGGLSYTPMCFCSPPRLLVSVASLTVTSPRARAVPGSPCSGHQMFVEYLSKRVSTTTSRGRDLALHSLCFTSGLGEALE